METTTIAAAPQVQAPKSTVDWPRIWGGRYQGVLKKFVGIAQNFMGLSEPQAAKACELLKNDLSRLDQAEISKLRFSKLNKDGMLSIKEVSKAVKGFHLTIGLELLILADKLEELEQFADVTQGKFSVRKVTLQDLNEKLK